MYCYVCIVYGGMYGSRDNLYLVGGFPDLHRILYTSTFYGILGAVCIHIIVVIIRFPKRRHMRR